MKVTPTVQTMTPHKNLSGQIEQSLVKVPAKWQQTVVGFLKYLAANGRSESTRISYLLSIRSLPSNGKRLQEFDAKDLMEWASGLNERCRDGELKPSTVATFKVFVRRFFKWLHDGTDPHGGYPEVVRWMNIGRRRQEYGKEVLSPEEIKALIESADNQRDRALIFVTYDSGARAAEILGLRVHDVGFDKFGAVIRVKGKTGERRIRLIESVPDLQLWLSMHPTRDDPDAPLWPSPRVRGAPLCTTRFYWITRKYAAKVRLGKRISPHVFRHSRATHLASVLKESQLREFFGWTKDSKMPAVYVHLSGRDIDETLLEHYGIKRRQQGPEERPLAPRTCPRCKHQNPAGAKFCMRCSAALDLRTALELNDKRKGADEIVERVIRELIKQAPEVLERVLSEPAMTKRIAEVSESVGGIA